MSRYLPSLLCVLSFVTACLSQILSGITPSAPSNLTGECLKEAGIRDVNQTYSNNAYAQVIFSWCSVYVDALDCIDKKLPDRKLSTEGDWFLSLVYDSKLAKDTSERVCAAFPDVVEDLNCLNNNRILGKIYRDIDRRVNGRNRGIPALSQIIHNLWLSKLFNDPNADNIACLAATHTAKSFHKHASMACPVNATNVITEYYLLLNGKCDMVLREKVAPPPPPKVTQGVITNTNTTVGDSQMNGTQTNDTQTNANKTNLPESTRISAKHQALQNRNEEFEKTMKEIENHSFIKHLERTGNDRELKEQLSRVRKINHLGLAKRMLRILYKMEEQTKNKAKISTKTQEKAIKPETNRTDKTGSSLSASTSNKQVKDSNSSSISEKFSSIPSTTKADKVHDTAKAAEKHTLSATTNSIGLSKGVSSKSSSPSTNSVSLSAVNSNSAGTSSKKVAGSKKSSPAADKLSSAVTSSTSGTESLHKATSGVAETPKVKHVKSKSKQSNPNTTVKPRSSASSNTVTETTTKEATTADQALHDVLLEAAELLTFEEATGTTAEPEAVLPDNIARAGIGKSSLAGKK